MNAALLIGVMAVGGWVLPSEEPSIAPMGTPLPSAAAPAPSNVRGLPPAAPSGATTPPAGQGPMAPAGAASPYQYGLPGLGAGSAGAIRSTGPQYLPLAPTDPALGSPESPWQSPTSAGTAPTLGFGSNPAARAVSPYATAARSGAGGYRSFAEYPVLGGAAANAARGASQPIRPKKPFANVQQRPTVSPYLNLFRNDNRGDTIDNYTTLVRPFVEQQFTNEVIGGEIQGLQSATRTQGRSLQRINQHIGMGAPEFFMNHGGYYQGFQRR